MQPWALRRIARRRQRTVREPRWALALEWARKKGGVEGIRVSGRSYACNWEIASRFLGKWHRARFSNTQGAQRGPRGGV